MGWPIKTNNVANMTGAETQSQTDAKAKPPVLPSLTDQAVQERARAQAAMMLTGRGRKSTFLTSFSEPMAGTRSTALGGGY